MDLIPTNNTDSAKYDRYEELLLARDRLRKEAHGLQMEYMREFGTLITDVFYLKMECIRKKKRIEYCQQAINRGDDVNADELDAYLAEQMRGYEEQLTRLTRERDQAVQMGCVDLQTLTEIKRLYRRLAKQLHPDINPRTNDIPVLRDLWQDVVEAYNANDLTALQEANVLVQRALEQLALGHLDVEIPDIDQRIQRITDEMLEIKTTNPYLYKRLLEDGAAVIRRRQELQDELAEYQRYRTELDGIMNQLITAGGLTFTWEMN